ncbi:uncharacterized protein A4U43_C08F6000 [Asparagus officinalis]|nr:uncharacterized protein A4U43_C08F6000 [Asparagus officinalis]
MLVFTDKSIKFDDNLDILQMELAHSDMLVIVAVNDHKSIVWLQKNSQSIPNVICFESSLSLSNKLGGKFIENRGQNIFGKLADVAKLRSGNESSDIVKTVSDAWKRHNTDDIRFCLLVIINSYIKPVPTLKNLRAKGLSTISCMLKNCRTEILDCLFDPNCRKALQCLNACSPTDQVCNYRCIASYESPYLEAFSLCVLQKNNCLELDAEIPSKPSVSPLTIYRGEVLSHEIAEDLFVGWLGSLEWSWRVVAGQNPAYDQFPCQYQLFYRGKARGSFWYEPVFQVKTLEGKLIWRRRKYRVKRGNIPGTFYFSVLDNGVVSKEFWTIIDVADDFSWGLFHYSGAAAAAGGFHTQGLCLLAQMGNIHQKCQGRG